MKILTRKKRKTTKKEVKKDEIPKDEKSTKESPPEKNVKSEKPADLRFANSKNKDSKPENILMLKVDESLADGLKRLKEDGWSVDKTKYIKQGRVLRAVGKRVKSAARDLKKGDPCHVEYYDILEGTEDAMDPGKIWDEKLFFHSTKGTMLVFTTEKETFMGFPVAIIANITKLEASSDSPDSGQENIPDEKDKADVERPPSGDRK